MIPDSYTIPARKGQKFVARVYRTVSTFLTSRGRFVRHDWETPDRVKARCGGRPPQQGVTLMTGGSFLGRD